jgi:hypothetical protein
LPEPVSGFSGEQPGLLTQAYKLAEQQKGLTIRTLAESSPGIPPAYATVPGSRMIIRCSVPG